MNAIDYVSHDDNKERVAKKSISIKANLYKLWRACFSASAKKVISVHFK